MASWLYCILAESASAERPADTGYFAQPSDVPARLRLKAVAWARLMLAWAHQNLKPSPSRQTGLGSGRLGLKPRLFSSGRYSPIEQCSTDVSVAIALLQCIVTYWRPVDFAEESVHLPKYHYYIGMYDITPKVNSRACHQLRRYHGRFIIKVSMIEDSYYGIPAMQSELDKSEIWHSNPLTYVYRKPRACGRLKALKTPSQALSPRKPPLRPGTAWAFTGLACGRPGLEPEPAHH